jgi:hypothetical protein
VTDGNPEVAEAEWQKRPANTRRGGAVRRRLISNRYPLAMSVGLFAALYFAGMLPGYVALVCAILMAAVSIFAPVRTAEARRAELLGDRTGSRDWKRSEAIIESFPDPYSFLIGAASSGSPIPLPDVYSEKACSLAVLRSCVSATRNCMQ